MTSHPIPCVWTGGEFVPEPGFLRRAREQFGQGEVVHLAPYESRSGASHNHYFAAIKDGWENLPEHLSKRFPTTEHLRKYALIKAGYADCRTFVASSATQALKLADFMRPADPFSVVTIDAATVSVWTAQSQSQRAMGKTPFQESKSAVLEIIAGMIDVKPEQLGAAA